MTPMTNPRGLARPREFPAILAIFRAGFGLRLADHVDYYSYVNRYGF